METKKTTQTQEPSTEALKDFTNSMKEVIEKHGENDNVAFIFAAVEIKSESDEHQEAEAAIGIHGKRKHVHSLAEAMKENGETKRFFGRSGLEGLKEFLESLVEETDTEVPATKKEDIN